METQHIPRHERMVGHRLQATPDPQHGVEALWSGEPCPLKHRLYFGDLHIVGSGSRTSILPGSVLEMQNPRPCLKPPVSGSPGWARSDVYQAFWMQNYREAPGARRAIGRVHRGKNRRVDVRVVLPVTHFGGLHGPCLDLQALLD